MITVRDLDYTPHEPVVAAIGFFDGLHKGHAYLLSRVAAEAGRRGMASAVVTFPQHPLSVVCPAKAPKQLSTFEEKEALIAGCGIDYCFCVDFNEGISSLSAFDFMKDILQKRFGIAVLLVGYDNRFGHNREEGFDDYRRYGEMLGMEVVAVDRFVSDYGKVCSSAVRKAVASGNVELAANLMGREYRLSGIVGHGYSNGRKLGFATANIEGIAAEKLIPANGVYAVRVETGGGTYLGMMNIGERPTVSWDGLVSAEVHIFDFDRDIYGQKIIVAFFARIRDEKTFGSSDLLVEQLREDKRAVETLFFAERHSHDNPYALALKKDVHADVDMDFALRQIEGRQVVSRKVPSWAGAWGLRFPLRLSLEQCSSELAARFKAKITGGGETMTDLTGGLGVDFYFISRTFGHALYVERDKGLCALAEHNMRVLGAGNVTVECGDMEEVLKDMPCVDLIYADPARRNGGGGKVVFLSDCSPDLRSLETLLLRKGRRLMFKLSPMLDIDAALKDLPYITDIYVISVRNECKELLLLMDGSRNGVRHYHCVNIESECCCNVLSFSEAEKTADAAVADCPEAYLYEPNASVMKANAWGVLTRRFNVAKIARNSNLFTSSEPVCDFPGRMFVMDDVYGFDKKDLKRLAGNVSAANIAVRNFHASADEVRKRLKIAEGGDKYLFVTTLADGKKVILQCSKYKKS